VVALTIVVALTVKISAPNKETVVDANTHRCLTKLSKPNGHKNKHEKAECGEKQLPSVYINTFKTWYFQVALQRTGLLAAIHVKSHKKKKFNPNLENMATECLHLKSVATALKGEIMLLQENFCKI